MAIKNAKKAAKKAAKGSREKRAVKATTATSWKAKVTTTKILRRKSKVVRLVVGCPEQARLGNPIPMSVQLDILAPRGLNPLTARGRRKILDLIKRNTFRGRTKVAGVYPRCISNGNMVLGYRVCVADVVSDVVPVDGHGDRQSINPKTVKWCSPLTLLVGEKLNRRQLAAFSRDVQVCGNDAALLKKIGASVETFQTIEHLRAQNPTAKKYVMLDAGTFWALAKDVVFRQDPNLPRRAPNKRTSASKVSVKVIKDPTGPMLKKHKKASPGGGSRRKRSMR